MSYVVTMSYALWFYRFNNYVRVHSISSLIDQLFITVGGFYGKGQQTAFFNKVDLAAGALFQFSHHVGYGEQRNARVLVILHQYVHIAFRCLLTPGKENREEKRPFVISIISLSPFSPV